MSNENPVFSAIASLSRRFSATARGLPEKEKIVETRKLISFELIGRKYLVPLDEVVEILPVPEVTRLPRVKGWVRGVANVRGRLLPIIDFADFLNQRLSSTPREQRVVVVDMQGVYVGLIVDQVFGLKTLPVDQFHKASMGGPLAQFVDGFFVEEEVNMPLFRPYRLVDDRQFLSVAA